MIPLSSKGGILSPQADRLGPLLPLRRLGKTGEEVTMLGIGGAHVGRADEKTAQALIETALEGGIRFFDNAESYSRGRAESYYGKYLSPSYRDLAFIMTKSTGRDASTVQQHLDASLKRLNTDYVDLFQIHAVSSPEDVDHRMDEKVLEQVLKAREAGKIRHVGFTGHADYKAHLRMLQCQTELQTCQMPVNCFDPNYKSFILNVMPELVKQNYGILAMKTLSNGGFFGGTRHFNHGDEPRIIPDKVSIEEALQFVWSLPVSVLITGAETPEMLQEKIDMARRFSGMSAGDREDLIARVADFDGRKVEYYKS